MHTDYRRQSGAKQGQIVQYAHRLQTTEQEQIVQYSHRLQTTEQEQIVQYSHRLQTAEWSKARANCTVCTQIIDGRERQCASYELSLIVRKTDINNTFRCVFNLLTKPWITKTNLQGSEYYDQCIMNLSVLQDAPVEISVYYESLCPDSVE